MEQVLECRIILENPTPGVDFGLQKGKGRHYEIIQKQRSAGKNLIFTFNIRAGINPGKAPVFLGEFTQGSPVDRFVYIGIGTFAGQKDTPWSRRLKIPLKEISPEKIEQLSAGSALVLQTIVSGTGRDGGPNCGTVKPFNGWELTPG